mmetsp:Transcript_16798/g.38810  ORF Transcript_16798/g.38810 Transcript_16798/m.38810 type:complete len:101 (+) Transcript_16798:88-390(+)
MHTRAQRIAIPLSSSYVLLWKEDGDPHLQRDAVVRVLRTVRVLKAPVGCAEMPTAGVLREDQYLRFGLERIVVPPLVLVVVDGPVQVVERCNSEVYVDWI